MENRKILIFGIVLLTFLALAVSVSANTISDYGDPFIQNNITNTCTTTARGVTITATPCIVSSPTGHTSYDIDVTGNWKLAVASAEKINIGAIQHTTESRQTKIFSKAGLKNITIDAPVKDASKITFVKDITSKNECKYGRGQYLKEVDIDYANKTVKKEKICYDHYDSKKLEFLTEENNLVTQVASKDFPISKEITVSSPITYDGMHIYDIGVDDTTIKIDWDQNPFNGFNSLNKKYYVIAYQSDLMSELESGTVTILDPFFDSDWTSRKTINLTCPTSLGGCQLNDTMYITLDTREAGLPSVLTTGADVRIVHRNDTLDTDQVEIPFVNMSVYNSATTTLAFKIPFAIPDGLENKTGLYLYWNNDGATAPTYTVNDVFNKETHRNDSRIIAHYGFDNFSFAATQVKDDLNVMGDPWNTATTTYFTVTSGTAGVGPNVQQIGNWSNGTTGVYGNSGSSLAISGNNVHLALSAAPNVAFNNFTHSMWFKHNASGQSARMVRGDGGADIDSLLNNGAPECRFPGKEQGGCIAASPDEWHFWSCTFWANGTVTNMVDGKTCGEGDGAGTAITLTADLTVGFSATVPYKGLIDDLTFWNYSMSPRDHQDYYNRTRMRTSSFTDGNINFTFGADENSSNAPAAFMSSIVPNGTTSGVEANNTANLTVLVDYTSDVPNDGANMTGIWYINGTNPLNETVLNPTANSTHQYNLSSANFSRNSTIIFGIRIFDNASVEGSLVNSTAVTITNVKPSSPIFDITSTVNATEIRTRKNLTINLNATDHEGDFIYFSVRVNDTLQCGEFNSSIECSLYEMAEGENIINLTSFDGGNQSERAEFSIFVDETAPNFTDIQNTSIGETTADLYIVADEPVNVSISYGASTDCTSFGLTSVRTTFNESTSIQLTGLTAATQYCWRATINDNVTSSFGANSNNSNALNHSFTTSAAAGGGSPAAGGGGGGGGTRVIQTGNKTICDISVTPEIVEITDAQNFATVSITNNEEVSYTPDVGLINDSDSISAVGRIKITNEAGGILPGNTAQVGIILDSGILGSDPIVAFNNLLLEDDRCSDILVAVNTNVTGGFAFLPDFDLNFSLGIGEIVDEAIETLTGLIERAGEYLAEPIVESVESVRVYMLLILFGILFGALIFLSQIAENRFIDLTTKIVGWLTVTPLVTALVVTLIRNLLG